MGLVMVRNENQQQPVHTCLASLCFHQLNFFTITSLSLSLCLSMYILQLLLGRYLEPKSK